MEYVGKGKTALMPCNRSHGIEIRNLDADPIEGRSVIKTGLFISAVTVPEPPPPYLLSAPLHARVII